jgi:type II secretory pathway pseudopilin PulG
MQMKRQNSRAKIDAERGGFTIAEILLVVIIVALVAGVGGGIWVGTYKKMLAEKAALGFVFAAKHARLTAIERQSPCMMELDTEENRFALVIYALDVETGRTEQVPLRDFYFKKPVEFAGDVEFEDIQITPIGEREMAEADEEKTIVFSPDGTAQSAVIQMGDGRNHYTVSISAATGRAKMHFGTADEVETGTVDLDEER